MGRRSSGLGLIRAYPEAVLSAKGCGRTRKRVACFESNRSPLTSSLIMQVFNMSSAYVSNDTFVHLMHYYATPRLHLHELDEARDFVRILLAIAIPTEDEEGILRLLCIYAELEVVVSWAVEQDLYSVQLIHEHYYNP